MQVNGRLQCGLQTHGVALYPFGMFEQIFDAYQHEVASLTLRLYQRAGGERLFIVDLVFDEVIAQFLQRVDLLFTQVFQLLQRDAFIEQLRPLREAMVAL